MGIDRQYSLGSYKIAWLAFNTFNNATAELNLSYVVI